MDTKWKNRKKTISFLLFFLGISLTLGSAADILRMKPSGVRPWEIDRLLETDYQESSQFRSYIANRLETLLIMATGGDGLLGIWGYKDGTYYGGGYDGDYYYGDFYSKYGYYDPFTEAVPELLPEEAAVFSAEGDRLPISAEELTAYLDDLQYMEENYLGLLEVMEEMKEDPEQLNSFWSELENYQNELQNSIEYLKDYLPDRLSQEQINPLTEEQKRKIAEKYHDNMKGNRNLLYTVLYDGKVLYSNADLLPTADTDNSTNPGSNPSTGDTLATAYGNICLPEGYNFLLYFDGEKARILKDGKELDVYGDGYYRENSDWYLPGYANFQTAETVKKAAVCMAVAEEPLLFTQESYGNGSIKQYDNSLYWMHMNLQGRREQILQSFTVLAAGLLLLLLSFFLRKSRREAVEGIARFQAKIWVECKLVLLLGLLFCLYMVCRILTIDGSGYDLWQEFAYAYEYNYDFSSLSWFFREMLCNMPPLVWILLFWGIWLLVNDLRHNKKIWRCSLTAKLVKAFSAKNLQQPLPRKMSRRNRTLFLASLLYGLLMLQEMLLPCTLSWQQIKNIWIPILFLAVLETVLFLALQYRIGGKNMKTARDLETLSRRITEIRNGDYTAGSAGDSKKTDGPADGSCRDLEAVMAQLEDIRHGMANAVDEQMKSERMKVELIANVSHDIKTPLTSIISYVEFLKQEEELPEHVKDYVKILDEKSQRLKNMVTDVFAVSKAASGELPMQMELLDFGKLLRQTLADMEEQIQSSPVTFRTDLPDAPVTILADGQRLYRVFQNLFQNAIKYSLQGSRVYVTLKANGSLAIASVKNTSCQELDREKDFAERFTRGDQSRTDGGSGLGLSIAQSFTEACGGTFSWETDADLFVVKIAFQISSDPV